MPDPTVLVVGCGHVGQAVVELAHWLGFHVVACDDREELCNPQAVPYADAYVVCQPEDIATETAIHAQTYIAALTRGVPFDVAMLPRLLETPAPYIGVIGSRRRWATTVKELAEKGIDEAALGCVHAPIGLELRAETPREIAVSILAEILAQQKSGTGQPMKQTGEKGAAHADVR
jgi:xanthine dehydrogenase accessory factor